MEDRCFRCDRGVHKSPDCPLKEQNKWFCYKCQSVQNHIAAKCPNHRLSRNRYRVKARLVTLDNFADQSPTVTAVSAESPSALGREEKQNDVESSEIEVPIKRKILDLNSVVPQNDIENLSNQSKEIEPTTKFPNAGMLWHLRLGHASLRYLQQLQKQEEQLQNVKFVSTKKTNYISILFKTWVQFDFTNF
ncbi:hypothetical protein TKK_0015532 [Trichogramma kaykai]